MLINIYMDKEYYCTINFDQCRIMDGFINKVWFRFQEDNNGFHTEYVKNSKSLAEEISIYAALGEKLICVNLSDEYELGYKIIPLSDFSFAEDRE